VGGVGIPPAEMDAVFERFHRGPDGGTGLGLAIARHVVDAHRGRIAAEARTGGGTTFIFVLPRWSDLGLDDPILRHEAHQT